MTEKEAIEKIEEELSLTEDDTKTIILLWKKTELLEDIIQTQQEEIEKNKKVCAVCSKEKRRLRAELEKKDKIIDEAIEWIKSLHDSLIEEYGTYETEFSINGDNVEENKIKEYFINKVEKESKDEC